MAEWDHDFNLGDVVEAKAWLYDVSTIVRIVQLSNTQAWLEGINKPFNVSELKKHPVDRTTAEANEIKFRKLLEEAHEILSHLPLPAPVIADLRYRILDTLNETPTVDERQGIIEQPEHNDATP